MTDRKKVAKWLEDFLESLGHHTKDAYLDDSAKELLALVEPGSSRTYDLRAILRNTITDTLCRAGIPKALDSEAKVGVEVERTLKEHPEYLRPGEPVGRIVGRKGNREPIVVWNQLDLPSPAALDLAPQPEREEIGMKGMIKVWKDSMSGDLTSIIGAIQDLGGSWEPAKPERDREDWTLDEIDQALYAANREWDGKNMASLSTLMMKHLLGGEDG